MNQYQRAWDELEPEERARLQARQGVGMICADWMRVVDSEMNPSRTPAKMPTLTSASRTN